MSAAAPVQSVAPLLAATEVTVRFGGVVALDQVSLAVPVGSTVGLVGPNGAGKTTLFGVLSGLVRPKAGRVTMNGTDVTGRSPQHRAHRGLARTFQRMELFTELTVREHLVVARRVKDGRERLLGMVRDLSGFGEMPGAGEDEAVDGILDLLGLDISRRSAGAGDPARHRAPARGRSCARRRAHRDAARRAVIGSRRARDRTAR